MRRHLVLLPLVLGFAACGPYLETQLVSRSVVTPEVRCTQGPLVFRAVTGGSRWEEGIRIVACSPRDIQGRVEVRLGGEEVWSGTWGGMKITWGTPPAGPPGSPPPAPQLLHLSVERPDNARCVASVEEAGAGLGVPVGSGAGEPVGVVVASPPGEGSAGGGDPVPGEAVPVAWRAVAAGEHPFGEAIELAYPCAGQLSFGYYNLVDWRRGNEDPERTALEAGLDLEVTLWSAEPNDLEGVFFVADHLIGVPDVSDAEWIVHLEEERREREAEDRERQAKWEAEQREREREAAEWQAHCAADHGDEECWGPGGYAGAVERQRLADEEARRRAAEPVPPVEAVAVEAPPARREPDGPPPALPVETPPPRPSEHAEWVPGYWHWSGFAWGWLAGWWRVPQADIDEGLTVRAPEAPPPPQHEARPPAPAPDAVWTAGFWQWDGAVFVWVKGSWQLPPRPESEWRPAEWRIEASGAVFLPGGWSVRIGR